MENEHNIDVFFDLLIENCDQILDDDEFLEEMRENLIEIKMDRLEEENKINEINEIKEHINHLNLNEFTAQETKECRERYAQDELKFLINIDDNLDEHLSEEEEKSLWNDIKVAHDDYVERYPQDLRNAFNIAFPKILEAFDHIEEHVRNEE